MTNEQLQTESIIKEYIKSLDEQLKKLSHLNGANTEFQMIQNAYSDSIIRCIAKAKDRIQEVKEGAVWDNLVIAFFGETNAGKSTIIETFRILFGEEERQRKLKNNPEGVDGLIVGNGTSDFTQVYKEYKMSISGVPFTLIDVPGIEGNENKFESEIREALNKAHYVFYVQGENKKPDTGTAGKIKKYLKEWVKVYSIYNVKGGSGCYDEENERKTLLTKGGLNIESQIKETFKDVLGRTYMGNISLQACLALCSKAKFAPSKTKLLREQKKLISYFGGTETMFQFSQFESLINLVHQKAKNFTSEIVEANKEKHKALLLSMFNEIKAVSDSQEKSIGTLENDIKDFQKNIKQDFAACKNNISNIASRNYDLIFSKVSDMAMYAIDNEVGDKKAYCKRRSKTITSEVALTMQQEISDIIKKLNTTIRKRKRHLDQKIASATTSGYKPSLNLSPDFNGALDKLDFGITDFVNIITAGISAVGTYFALANFWNPLGWFAAAAVVVMWLFGGRDKKAEAKEGMRNNIAKAKADNRADFDKQISQIKLALDNCCGKLVKSVDKDKANLEMMRSYIQDTLQSIKLEYSKLKISDYGTF